MAIRDYASATSQSMGGQASRVSYLLGFSKPELLRFAKNVLKHPISDNVPVEEIVARIVAYEKRGRK